MADENTETDSIAYQPPPTVVTLYDRDGRAHHTSPTSKFAVDGLADGTLTEEPAETDEQNAEEVPDGAEAGSAGDNPEPGNTDGGSGPEDGTPETGGPGRRRRAGQA